MSTNEFGRYEGRGQRQVGFLLSDTFNMLPFIAAIDPLRVANRVCNENKYNWLVISVDGAPVYASNGLEVAADCAIDNVPELDALFVAGPFFPTDMDNPAVFQWLQEIAQLNILMGGIETGCNVLAKAGLLKGYHCTTHWENIDAFKEMVDGELVQEEIYEHDRNRITCAGGTASFDMMLYLVEKQLGSEVAASVADFTIHPQRRDPSTPQRMSIGNRLGINHPSLLSCIELMEANLEQPLTPTELSDLVGISKRQLERLFRGFLQTTPARYYLNLRLHEAKNLLETGNAKIIDVAIATGFKSAGHFSSRYNSAFGETPRETRKP